MIIARLKELSPDNAQLASDLSVLDGEIAKLERAGAAQPITVEPVAAEPAP